jgi:hypothetical protein
VRVRVRYSSLGQYGTGIVVVVLVLLIFLTLDFLLFSLLRVQEGHSVVSMVCDVNGWSFVKNSRKYYDDCAQIMTEHILAAVKPNSLRCFSTLDPLVTTSKNIEDDESAHSFFRPSATLSRVAKMLQRESIADDAVSDAGTDAGAGANAPTTLLDGAVPVRELPE